MRKTLSPNYRGKISLATSDAEYQRDVVETLDFRGEIFHRNHRWYAVLKFKNVGPSYNDRLYEARTYRELNLQLLASAADAHVDALRSKYAAKTIKKEVEGMTDIMFKDGFEIER